MINYYDVIGVSRNASEEEIDAKIKAEMTKWRKRVNAPTPEKRREAEEKQELILEAEEILLDPEKRNTYDQELMRQQNTQNQQSQPIDDVSVAHLEELESRYNFYYNEGNHYEASLVCKEFIKLEPYNAYAWKNLSFSNLMLHNYAEARYEINKAISLIENDSSIYFTAYQIYEGSVDLTDVDRMKRARAYIDKALEIDPNNPLYNECSAELYYDMGNYQQAINILERFKTNDYFEYGKDLLALSYLMKAQREHTELVSYPNGYQRYYFTSRESIEKAKEMLQYALDFAHYQNTIDSIRELNSFADDDSKFEYNFKYLILLVICALWFSVALEGFNIIQLGISGLVVYFSWQKFREPVYVKNKKYIDNLKKK